MEKKNELIWPVPESYEKTLPGPGQPGSFWEFRGDRYHCGVDIYAPNDSLVIAAETGIVVDAGIFTLPELRPYWNKTYFVTVRTGRGLTYKYAELGSLYVKKDETIEAGHVLGTVGLVLNVTNITAEAPGYVSRLIQYGNPSMLHLEMYNTHTEFIDPYFGGNYFGNRKPDFLLNPNDYFESLNR